MAGPDVTARDADLDGLLSELVAATTAVRKDRKSVV